MVATSGRSSPRPKGVWRAKGWIRPDDPRNIRRHLAQIEKHCERRDMACRPRQRQSLLRWAYDSREL